MLGRVDPRNRSFTTLGFGLGVMACQAHEGRWWVASALLIIIAGHLRALS